MQTAEAGHICWTLVSQAMDAAGKDGTIKHVMSGVNPQGCQVFSFKQPSSEDLDHDFLWRYVKSVTPRYSRKCRPITAVLRLMSPGS